MTANNTRDEDDQSDSDVVFDLVERLVARGYRVRVAIDMPGGNRLTLTGEPGA